jgi:peptidoglycan/xylan/chitin deacetylase (PgdA/CDA1 family)
MPQVFLLRYDTESTDQKAMAGFFEKVVDVHRAENIPATFFCTGMAVEAREKDFRTFAAEVKDDPLFDIQDHSYSHIGLGYTNGMSIDDLRANYQQSFAVHERILGNRPIGISICGTGGKDGSRLKGFDETDKGKEELDMVANLGVHMINSHLVDFDEATQFCSFELLGHPEVMGFPSAYSDTQWLYRRECGDPMEYVFTKIKEHADNDDHMPLMLHDLVAWNHAFDKELTHVKKIIDYARRQDFELRTHLSCYDMPPVWKENDA